MYYDNKNPFERDSYRDLMCRDAKQSFSRFSLGIFAYVAVSYLFVILLDVILFIVLRDAYVKVIENVYYQWAVGVLPMYIIGLPFLYVIVRNMPRRSLPKSKLSLGEFLCFFAISRALMIIGNVIGNTLNGFFASLRGDEISNSTAELIDNSPICRNNRSDNRRVYLQKASYRQTLGVRNGNNRNRFGYYVRTLSRKLLSVLLLGYAGNASCVHYDKDGQLALRRTLAYNN